MKHNFSTSIIVTALAIVSLISCKKDVPAVQSSVKAINAVNAQETSGINAPNYSIKKPGIWGGLLDSTKTR